jgi:RNA polymerase sigma-70 factor (ECF subfamily)
MLTDITKEKALLARLKQNDSQAFDELVELYRGRGFAISYNILGNTEDAKDVLQEAFLKVFFNIKGFKQEAKFSTWFYRILVNCSWDFLRKRKRQDRLFIKTQFDEADKQPEVPDSHLGPSKFVMDRELADKLEDAISLLPEKQRICFILKHQNQMSNQEIAQTLNCGLSTVKVHLFRAVRGLQERLAFYLVK